MVYQVKITTKDPDKADAVFEAVQNGGDFYDNCVIEHSMPPVIIVEGHNEDEVKALYETYKGEEKVLNISSMFTYIKGITMESAPDEDTILDNRREETGCLMVRTAGYYEDLLRKILSVKEVLPALMRLDNYFDTMIAEALKK